MYYTKHLTQYNNFYQLRHTIYNTPNNKTTQLLVYAFSPLYVRDSKNYGTLLPRKLMYSTFIQHK